MKTYLKFLDWIGEHPYTASNLGLIIIGLVLLFISSCNQLVHADEVPTIVQIARTQLGKGEQGGNNKGKEVKNYTAGREVPWCAGFVSWCRFRSGNRTCYFLAAKQYWNSKMFSKVQRPSPGDLIIFRRGLHQGHIGIIETVQGTRITTIEGNVGKYPAVVKRFTYTLGHIKNLLGFVRSTERVSNGHQQKVCKTKYVHNQNRNRTRNLNYTTQSKNDQERNSSLDLT